VAVIFEDITIQASPFVRGVQIDKRKEYPVKSETTEGGIALTRGLNGALEEIFARSPGAWMRGPRSGKSRGQGAGEAFGERAVLRVMYAALIDATPEGAAFPIRDFERRRARN
jgi:hypothetical protein